jgi:sigma-B regulation protein RsbU (phosphoserine phosphatase)
MNKKLRVIIIEDSEFDAIIMAEVLEQGGYQLDYERVETPDELKEVLTNREWDLILSDYNLPDFNAPAALEIVKSTGLDLPFIIISGGIGEDVAVAAMKLGAHDYLMKGQLARLVVAVERELGDAATRKARKKAEGDLRENELRYRLLWENSNDGVVLMDEEGNILFANPAIAQMFGHSSEALLGEKLSMLIFDDGESRADGNGFSSNLSYRHLQEVVGNRQDGSRFPVEISCSSLEIHGRLMIAAFLRDITERKQAQHELELHEERLQTAREIQQWMFPKVPPTIDGFDIAGVSFPAEAAGGDYFDYLPMTGGRLGLVVADVTGHGIGPALLMSEARAYLRILALNRRETGEILTRANAVLSDDLNFERYITMVLVCLEPATRRLTFSNAGHPAALVIDEAGQVKAHLKRNGVPLGIRTKTTYATSDSLALDSGDLVFLYTDGFDEAMAEDESFFGTEKIVEIIHQFRALPSRDILQELYQSVDEFTGAQPQADDLTGILVKVS